MFSFKKFAVLALFPICFLQMSCTSMGKIYDRKHPALSFTMNNEEIDAFYQMLDELIDKNPGKITDLGVVECRNLVDEMLSNYFDEANFWRYGIRFTHNGRNYLLARSTIRPDGYINFVNYYYRDSSHVSLLRSKNFPDYAELRINPLKTSPGFVILENDIPAYEKLFAGEIPHRVFAGYEKIGLIKSSTVIRISYVFPDDFVFVEGIPRRQGLIKMADIKQVAQLRGAATYRIIDNKLYRFIEGQQIEIYYDAYSSGYNEKGQRYVRNDSIFNNTLDRFYFWERTGDYLFDAEGSFIGVTEFGPDWSGK